MLRPEIARIARAALLDVVEQGTARRLAGGLVLPDGRRIPVGGKTGTGDNRRDSYTAQGRLLRSEARSRTATFAFFLGDRFYGVLTCFVSGAQAEDYRFTSALPVQVLRHLAPDLAGLVGDAAAGVPLPATAVPVARGVAGTDPRAYLVEVLERMPPLPPPAPVAELARAEVEAPAAAETDAAAGEVTDRAVIAVDQPAEVAGAPPETLELEGVAGGADVSAVAAVGPASAPPAEVGGTLLEILGIEEVTRRP